MSVQPKIDHSWHTFLRALSDACKMANFLDSDLSLTLNAVILRENSDNFCLLASGSALRASCTLYTMNMTAHRVNSDHVLTLHTLVYMTV